MKRIRPIGAEWLEFKRVWETGNHDTKMYLAERYGISYDLAKHWYSDFKDEGQDEPKMTVGIEELLRMRPSTALDFVSFDIETSNLQADFSMVLTACIKPFGQPTITFRADQYPTWLKDRANDKPIVSDIAHELSRHAVVITHYGTRFDIPFLRAKMVHHGLPPLPQMFAIDSWRVAKDNFQVSSRKLKNLAEYFDIGTKEGVEGPLWMKAAYEGNTKAMDKILEHNVIDVEVLEKLAAISFPYLKFIRRL